MRIRDEYLHGSDLTGVVKKIEVTIGTGNNANQSVIKYIKADSEGGVVEVPIGDITGKAATASKLDNTSAIGSTTNPVYFTANGVPSACTYSLNATVPVGAANQVLYYSAPNTLSTQSYATLTSNLDIFTAATASAAGKKGLVPAPSANQLGAGNFFLRADGVWTVIESKSAALNGTDTSLVTTGEKYNWNSAYNWYNSMTSGDTDGIINKWKEVEAFLANYGDSSTLAAELAKLVTLSTDQTITGVKTFSEVINGSITGNAGTANKLKNTLTLGVLNNSGAVVGTDTLYDGSSALSFKVKAGSGITLTQSTKGEVVITNAAPDVDHNTDTKVKLTATDGTATDRYIPFPTTGTSISSGSAYELFYQSDFKYNPGTKLFSVPNIKVGEKITVTGTSALGTVTSGVWNGTPIANDYLAHKSVTINGSIVNLGESIIVTAVANGGNASTVGGYSPSDFLLKTEHETFESIIATALTDLDNRKIEASDIPTSLPANGGNADYAKYLRGRQTNGTYYGSEAVDNIIAEWNTKSDNRWYLKAASTYECRVDYATSAGNAATASSVDWSGVTNRPTNVSQFTNDAGYLTSHAYSYGSIDIYDVNGTKKTSNNTVSASVNTETLRLQEGENISITATNSETSGSDIIKIAVTGIESNINQNGYGQLALWKNGASSVSTTLQSATFNETLTVKAGSGIDFNGANGSANNDIWTISAIPYNCAITLSNNSPKSLIKDNWSADKDSVYLTSNGAPSGTFLAAGTYALWIEDRSTDSGTPNYYSGTFTCAGSATAGRLDEIALHSSMATSADTNAPTRIFVATQISGAPGKHVLRFCSLDTSATNHYLTVKVNRII